MHVPQKETEIKKKEVVFSSFFFLGCMLQPTYFITSQGKKKVHAEVGNKWLNFEYKIITRCLEVLASHLGSNLNFLICKTSIKALLFYKVIRKMNWEYFGYLYAVKHTNAIYFAGHSSKNHSKFSFPPKMTKEKYKEGFR